MKVLFVSNLYPPNAIGGYEQLCFDVADAFVRRGHEVSVLTSDYGGGEKSYEGQTIFRGLRLNAPADNIYGSLHLTPDDRAAIDQHNAQQLTDVVEQISPDVIFVWNLYFLSQSFVDVIASADLPSVFFLTDNWLAAFLKPDYVARYFRDYVFSRPSFLRNWVGRLRRKDRGRKVDTHAIFSSRFMERYYRRAGLEFADTTVIYNGVTFPDEPAQSRGGRCVGTGVRLLFAGRVVEIKGVMTAIRALPLVSGACGGMDIELSIVGDQQEKPFCDQVHALVRDLGLSAQISFLPPVSEAELPGLFASHDIYLFPSLYEPFSLTLLHAMNAGVPIVASSAGGNPEAIEHRRNGMLHQVGNHRELAGSVVELIHNPDLANRLGRAAQERSMQFQFEKMVNELDAYFQLLRGKE